MARMRSTVSCVSHGDETCGLRHWTYAILAILLGIGRELWGMDPMSSARINASNRKKLLQIARGSITFGFETRRPYVPKLEILPDALRETGASFVTLSNRGKLRGCTGSILAKQPLGLAVADNAFCTAFEDPRFKPLETAKFPQLVIAISVPSTPIDITFVAEADLLARLQPVIYGL